VTRRAASSVVVLDLDDTLYLERDYVLSGFRAVDRWLCERHDIVGFADRAVRQFAAGNRTRVFDAVLNELGVTSAGGLIAELVTAYRTHRPEIRLLDDAERLLARQTEGRAYALLTDGFVTAQRSKIDALGLRNRAIWPIVCTDEWGASFWKPHRRGYEHIGRHFACAPHAFVYVADNPEKDFIAPRALGWATVRVRRSQGVHYRAEAHPGRAADIVIETLDELTETLLGELFATRRG